jgi:hypothetical protein
MFGLAAAIVHNHLRRRCSLIYELHNGRLPQGKLFGFTLPSPTICFFSWLCMWLSLVTFVVAGVIVAITGLQTI